MNASTQRYGQPALTEIWEIQWMFGVSPNKLFDIIFFVQISLFLYFFWMSGWNPNIPFEGEANLIIQIKHVNDTVLILAGFAITSIAWNFHLNCTVQFVRLLNIQNFGALASFYYIWIRQSNHWKLIMWGERLKKIKIQGISITLTGGHIALFYVSSHVDL